MAMRSKSLSKVFSWILLGLLILGLAGFGAVNFGGSVTSIGSVGDKDISTDAYARALQNELRALEAQFGQTITLEQASVFGVQQRVLSQVVLQTALEAEAERIGLSVGDADVAKELQNIPAFSGPDGQFSRDNYRFALQNAGYTEAEFEETIRAETARTLLQAGVISGNAAPDAMIDQLLSYYLEARHLELTTLTSDDVVMTAALPGDDELQAHYDDNIDQYTQPERKKITYAILTPEMILDQVEISDETLQASYDARRDEFEQPERRLLDRLVFANAEVAAEKLAEISSGATSFEDLVTARGLSLLDVDMGDVTRSDLSDGADAIFDANLDDVVGPFNTDLGPALYRVNGVIDAQTTTFDEARDILFADLAADRARSQIETTALSVDDALAAGATLEELKSEFGMQVDIVFYHSGLSNDVTGYPAFRQAAQSVTIDDFPAVEYLADGGIFAIRMDGVEPAAPMPLDEIRDDVTNDLMQAKTMQAIQTLAQSVVDGTEQAGGVDLYENILRNDVGQILTGDILDAGFDLDLGATAIIEQADRVVIVKPTAILPADLDSDRATETRTAIEQEFATTLSNDLFNVYATQIQNRLGIELNQQAISAVHANFQ